MASEGMVDALRRAHRIMAPDGVVVDLHPTSATSAIEAGAEVAGYVDADAARERHAAADTAIAAVLERGLFVVEQVVAFTFYTYGDTIAELREYIEENWRDTRIDEETVSRARDLLRRTPGARPRARERVVVTTLRRRSE